MAGPPPPSGRPAQPVPARAPRKESETRQSRDLPAGCACRNRPRVRSLSCCPPLPRSGHRQWSIQASIIYLLSFNHLRNFEKYPVSVGSIFHGHIVRQRFPQTFLHVLADGVRESVASLSRLVHAVAV